MDDRDNRIWEIQQAIRREDERKQRQKESNAWIGISFLAGVTGNRDLKAIVNGKIVGSLLIVFMMAAFFISNLRHNPLWFIGTSLVVCIYMYHILSKISKAVGAFMVVFLIVFTAFLTYVMKVSGSI